MSAADSPWLRTRTASLAPRRVLALDGQQPPGDLLGAARGRAGQQLRGSPLGGDPGLARRQASLTRADASRGS